jgi:hypothetical protein
MRVKAEKMMKDYKSLKMELQVTEMQLGRFQGISEEDVISMMTFSHPDNDERVQTSSLSDKTAKIALNYKKVIERENDEWYDFLWNRYRKLTEEISFFEDSVHNLKSVPPQFVMDMVGGADTWDDLAAKYNISRRSVGNYRKMAVKELDVMYGLREKCVAEYMLS